MSMENILEHHYDIASCYSRREKNKTRFEHWENFISTNSATLVKQYKDNFYFLTFENTYKETNNYVVIKNIRTKNIKSIREIGLEIHGQYVEKLYQDIIPTMQSLYNTKNDVIPFYLSVHYGLILKNDDIRLTIFLENDININDLPIIEYDIYSCKMYANPIEVPFFKIIVDEIDVSNRDNFTINANLTGMYILIKNDELLKDYIKLTFSPARNLAEWLYDNHDNCNEYFVFESRKKIQKKIEGETAIFKLFEKEDIYENIPFSNIDRIKMENPFLNNKLKKTINLYIVVANVMIIKENTSDREYIYRAKYSN
jgi:hypothetical protein